MKRNVLTALIGVVVIGGGVGAASWSASEETSSAATALTRKLTWAPPTLTNPTTVTLSNSKARIVMDLDKDYIVKCPTALNKTLNLFGGRNVVMIGCTVNLPKGSGITRGAYFQNWTGTLHIEGLAVTGERIEGDAIDLATPYKGSIVQLENVYADTVYGQHDGFHADVVQNWSGPSKYRIDGLTGSSSYQGLFLQAANGVGQDEEVRNEELSFKNINLRGVQDAIGTNGRYLIYLASSLATGGTATFENVYLKPGSTTVNPCACYPEDHAYWKALKQGNPPAGDFVPKTAVGIGYVSPGYVSSSANPTIAPTPVPTPAMTPTPVRTASATPTRTASPAASATPSPMAPVTGDANGDGRVTITDLSVVISNWGKRTSSGDLNGDGTVGALDLSTILSHWPR